MMKSMVALSLSAAVAFPMTGCYLQDMIENVDGFEVGINCQLDAFFNANNCKPKDDLDCATESEQLFHPVLCIRRQPGCIADGGGRDRFQRRRCGWTSSIRSRADFRGYGGVGGCGSSAELRQLLRYVS